MTDQTIRCSVGITAYNEEANIGRLLQAILDQQLSKVEIAQIVVVASACTDRTEEIVREFMAKDPRIELYTQPKREGKTSAVNLFLKHATEDICAVESGDTLPGPDTFESLIGMFEDPTVGMTGAHKVPVNTPEHIVGFLTHLRLAMEHNLCMEIPRLGELIAFRKVFDAIPPDVAMDEAFVESLVIRRGLRVVYAPDAVVYNLGPESFGDFVRQRRRNYAGHLHLKNKYGHKVSSLDNRLVAKVAWREVKSALWLLYALAVLAFVELLSRVLGSYDYYIRRRTHVIWDMAWSQKGDVGAQAPPDQRNGRRAGPASEGPAVSQARQ
ncbi:MAG: glycosyltransferase [Anaerolineae bacterium]|jgi:biofilm PGA synthesis N-glycosyltransferase PgaC